MSFRGGKPLGSRAASSAESVNIMLRLDKGFCYLKAVAVIVADTSRAVSGGAWSEARAPAPPPSDKPGATPPGDAYAPLGAGASRAPPAAPRQTGPRAICTAPTQFHNCIISRRLATKIDNFRLLKKTRKHATLAKRRRQPRYRGEQ